jgi:serine protease AprX
LLTGALAVTVAAGAAAGGARPAFAAGGAPPPPGPASTTGADWTFGSRAGLSDIAKSIRADVAYRQGITGKGIGVALIDTGVVPVTGLTSGNIANGPDLSLESQTPGLLHKDGFGHGTHMAGIIAGRDSAAGTGFRGIAPDVKLTSIKVGTATGSVDVTQMMAAIDWVVQHRNDDPADPIRVLNLSYGTDSALAATSNPLAAAVENAWKAGIVVVVAAGNTGRKVTVPATDSSPIVVGSVDPHGTTDPSDDTISAYSSTIGRTVSAGSTSIDLSVDVLAPGKSVISLRDPGSYADARYPSARQDDRYFTGSGTSQAAAVVSGAVALILQKYPAVTPTQVREMLWGKNGVLGLMSSKPSELNLADIFNSPVPNWAMSVPWSTGTGSLQASRGSAVLTFGPDNVALTGENDLFGPLSTRAWAAASKAGAAWQAGSWMGHPWTGRGWGPPTDNQNNWNGLTWPGTAWSGRAWSDNGWSGRAWSGRAWSGAGFTSSAWSGVAWSGAMWQ